VNFQVPVDRANNLGEVEKIMVAALGANSFALKDPAPSVVLAELQEYAAIMTARAYVRSPDYWQAQYAMKKEVQAALDKAGILVPVPRQAAAIRNEPESGITRPPVSQPGAIGISDQANTG
jgi:small conductance mechanosensitive channel